MTSARLMTADEAFCFNMNTFPTLSMAATEAMARYNFFDHVFNTIGNGYRNHEEFVAEFTWSPDIAAMTLGYPEKYIGDKTLHTGFLEVRKLGDGIVFPVIGSALDGAYTEEEKALFPEVKHWTRCRRTTQIQPPYPNFKKEYSLFYRVDIDALDDSWLHAGVEFYENCRAFFQGEDATRYSGAWPMNPEAQQRMVTEYQTSIARCTAGIDSVPEQWTVISKAYGTTYRGDTAAFIQERWVQEHARINTFIDATVDMLCTHLNARKHRIFTL